VPVPAKYMWPVGQKDSPDECVLWHTPLTKDRNGNTVGAYPGTLPRAASFDSTLSPEGVPSALLYVGLYQTQEVVRIDSATGQILKQFPVGVRQRTALSLTKTASCGFRARARWSAWT
jgi:hypothetical protein